jgi:hypothetical protein
LQDWPDKELIILDDVDDSSFATTPTHPSIWYYCEPRQTIAEKRNRVNSLAKGELICHFDSDDWSDPTRLSKQVAFMKAQDKPVVGFNTLLFYEPSTQRVAQYIGQKDFPCGTSLLYRKWFWQNRQFEKPKLCEYGSDTAFVRTARERKQSAACDADGLMVARIHPGHTSTPTSIEKMNKQLTLADLPARFPR